MKTISVVDRIGWCVEVSEKGHNLTNNISYFYYKNKNLFKKKNNKSENVSYKPKVKQREMKEI